MAVYHILALRVTPTSLLLSISASISTNIDSPPNMSRHLSHPNAVTPTRSFQRMWIITVYIAILIQPASKYIIRHSPRDTQRGIRNVTSQRFTMAELRGEVIEVMIYPVVPCWIGGVHAGYGVQCCEEGGCYGVGEVG